MIITIDGPSGTGKSTVAKHVASRLGIDYFDTGAMFRSLCWYLMEKNIALTDEQAVSDLLPGFMLEVTVDENKRKYSVNGVDVTAAIRDKKITEAVSTISMYSAVRTLLGKMQRSEAAKKSAVFEGRDMGTAIFPHADYKFYLSASPEVRAERRFYQLTSSGSSVSRNEILVSINKRDHLDSTRELAPLSCPIDAVRIDTTFLNVEEVVELILLCIKKGGSIETS